MSPVGAGAAEEVLLLETVVAVLVLEVVGTAEEVELKTEEEDDRVEDGAVVLPKVKNKRVSEISDRMGKDGDFEAFSARPWRFRGSKASQQYYLPSSKRAK